MSNHGIMIHLLSRLGDSARIAFRNLTSFIIFDGSVAPSGHPVFKLGIIDSHFQMDRRSSCYLTQTGGLDSTKTNPVRLISGIAYYVYPDSWYSISRHVRLNSSFRYTIGVHLHMLLPKVALSLLRKLKN